jgi:phenylacetic acid degradation operon negative regulatory protein
MVRQGWLEPVRLTGAPGYALTPRAVRPPSTSPRPGSTGATRASWDGTWHLVVTPRLAERAEPRAPARRAVVPRYAPLADGTWIGPRSSGELDALLEAEGVGAQRLPPEHDGDTAPA